MNRLEKVDELLAKLNSYRPLSVGEVKHVMEQFMISFTYNSNAIEGCTLTYDETEFIIREQITVNQKPLKDHIDVIAHKQAFDYIEKHLKAKTPLTEDFIKTVHKNVLMSMPDDAGKYRQLNVRIGNRLVTVHTPPSCDKVPDKMNELIAAFNSNNTEHPIVKVARFHLEFECIHPFIDGNGRTGRLLANFELMKAGLLPVDIKFIDRANYYAAFKEYNQSNDITPMSNLFADYEILELTNRIEMLKS